jgi:RHS repeat-associated protein
VDTTNGTGICDNNPCDTLQSNTPVEVAVTGQGGCRGEIMAVMVSVTAINPTGTGVLGVGTTEADFGGGIVVFDPAQHASTTMIIPLTDTGTFTIGSWTQTDVAVDVIGVFRAPTRTWRYEYDTTGMRTAKQLDNTAGTGVEWRKEHTWTASGGLPLLLSEHQGAQSAYVIYGPGGTAIYQINTTGEVQYLHQDHQGSTRLTTNANGTTRNTITYNAHGEIIANTNWWLEQPLAGYTGQYHDPETGYIYLRARHYDPTTGQFTTQDPLVAMTEEPYGYVGGNPMNRFDPSGLCGFLGDGPCTPTGIIEETTGLEVDCALGKNNDGSCTGAEWVRENADMIGATAGGLGLTCALAGASGAITGWGVAVAGACAGVATTASMAATIAKVVVYCGTDPSSSACHQAAALGAVATILDRLGVRALAAAGDDILRFFIGTASKLAGYVVDSHGYRLFGFVDCG